MLCGFDRPVSVSIELNPINGCCRFDLKTSYISILACRFFVSIGLLSYMQWESVGLLIDS